MCLAGLCLRPLCHSRGPGGGLPAGPGRVPRQAPVCGALQAASRWRRWQPGSAPTAAAAAAAAAVRCRANRPLNRLTVRHSLLASPLLSFPAAAHACSRCVRAAVNASQDATCCCHNDNCCCPCADCCCSSCRCCCRFVSADSSMPAAWLFARATCLVAAASNVACNEGLWCWCWWLRLRCVEHSLLPLAAAPPAATAAADEAPPSLSGVTTSAGCAEMGQQLSFSVQLTTVASPTESNRCSLATQAAASCDTCRETCRQTGAALSCVDLLRLVWCSTCWVPLRVYLPSTHSS